ncbi:hypothetical protein EVAR_37350_1 [Eumeta japonica]|uniref:Uncharacterized protein n=1 Tax=Eumeta variegata TaxID=151549 RepID=A0A4C1X1T7_EUMVA|nr:hypothetical protein EVAR_37350_1 [Eumeta japonica]
MSVLSGLTKADFKTASDGLLELSEERLRAVMRTEPITHVYHVEERPFARQVQVRKQVVTAPTRDDGAGGAAVSACPRPRKAAHRSPPGDATRCLVAFVARQTLVAPVIALFVGPAAVSAAPPAHDRFRPPHYGRSVSFPRLLSSGQ